MNQGETWCLFHATLTHSAQTSSLPEYSQLSQSEPKTPEGLARCIDYWPASELYHRTSASRQKCTVECGSITRAPPKGLRCAHTASNHVNRRDCKQHKYWMILRNILSTLGKFDQATVKSVHGNARRGTDTLPRKRQKVFCTETAQRLRMGIRKTTCKGWAEDIKRGLEGSAKNSILLRYFVGGILKRFRGENARHTGNLRTALKGQHEDKPRSTRTCK